MIWQDFVLAVCSLTFTLALIPSIRGKEKPALTTSLLTSLVLVTVAVTYATLSLWFAVAAAFLNLLAWLILAVQKFNQVQ